MRDQFGRDIDYLRISVTDRCNLRCIYCMPEGQVSFLEEKERLSCQEMVEIVRILAGLGVKHVRVTGGEPLLFPDCIPLIRQINKIPEIETVSITTNGTYLKELAGDLVSAGIAGVNVSLDTLDPIKYQRITRGGNVKDVLEGLETIMSYPRITVKTNTVLLGQGCERDVRDLARLARDHRIAVRYIEQMPIGQLRSERGLSQAQAIEILESAYGPLRKMEDRSVQGFGPSIYYRADHFLGSIGFISAISHKFCQSCNRIRLTADGRLRNCLQSSQMIDLKRLLRQGDSLEELREVIREAVWQKPRGHHFETMSIGADGMSQIGG